jgi:hypothetical protein
MKKTLKTYLTQTNWPVDNYYEDKGNDKQKEIYLNEYWTACAERLRFDILEDVDRKQEWLYGRSFMKLNILDGWFYAEVIDPQDVLLDRFMNPWDLNSARRITHVGIYRTLSDCERNPMYDKAAIISTAASRELPAAWRMTHSRDASTSCSSPLRRTRPRSA